MQYFRNGYWIKLQKSGQFTTFQFTLETTSLLILLKIWFVVLCVSLDRRLVWLWWGMLMPIGMPC
jgi:hypothetical protein